MRKVLYILGHLSDDDTEWMAEAGHRLQADAGQVLIRQGQPSPYLFVVLDGGVAVEVSGAGVVARLGSGEVMGEMSFVDSALPSATVRAEAGCVVLALEKTAIEARLKGDPGFAGRFYKALAIFLADRLRSQNERLSSPSDGLSQPGIQQDELDDAVLDQVSLAGLRFERMIKTLMSARAA